MWRQGDVLIQTVEAIPPTASKVRGDVLARGDSTGQRHRIMNRKTVQLFATPAGRLGEMFLEVLADQAEIVHPEHETIVLERGCYRVWRQREFDDAGPRMVWD